MAHSYNIIHSPAQTRYMYATGGLNRNTDEAPVQIVFHSPGSLSNFLVNVISNDLNGSTTVRVRINSANGNQSITIPSSTTGIFEDETNIDVLADGDLVAYQSVTGGTLGNIDMTPIRCLLLTDEDTVTRMAATGTTTFSAASTTTYEVLCGAQGPATVENDAKCRQRKPGTYKNFATYVLENGRSTTTTTRFRLNGANTTLAIAIGAGLTGMFEDITGTVAVVSGDDANFSTTTGTGVGDFKIQTMQVDLVSADFTGIYIAGNTLFTPKAEGTTSYFPLMGTLSADSNESDAQVRSGFIQADYLELTVKVTQNNVDNASTFNVRKNGANGNLSISIPANTTGVFTDTSETLDSAYPDDEVNLRLVIGAGVGGDTMTLSNTVIWAFIVPFKGQAGLSMSASTPQFTDYHNYNQQSNFFGSFNSPMFGD